MSWAKRNLYFLISGIVAVVLLGAAGWYAYSSWQTNSAAGDSLKAAYDQLAQIASKPVGAGNDTVNNIEATQVLLEACAKRPLERLVYASSSSVYGDNASMPMREDALPQPVSPYGVSKLAAEQLCYLYHVNYGVPAV